MRKILVIQDGLPGDEIAVKFAASLAQKTNACLMLAYTGAPSFAAKEKVIAGSRYETAGEVLLMTPHTTDPAPFKPIVISEVDTRQLAELIDKEGIWMILKSASASQSSPAFNLNSLLGRIQCPLFFIPENWEPKELKRLVYLADLRYCRIEVVRYLAALAGYYHADLSITHLTKEGLTHMDEQFASKVFDDAIRRKIRYDRLFFNYTRETNLKTAGDVLINGLHQDLLAMTANRYHFKGLTEAEAAGSLPPHISVPLLIFPG